MSSSVSSIPNTDKINYVNIGLMILALGVAFYVPFELFLFSYAVLGPGHYLTEISWLQKRGFFSKGKYDYVFLTLAAVVLFLIAYVLTPKKLIDPDTHKGVTTAIIYVAFIGALAMVLIKSAFYRFIVFIFIAFTALISKELFVLFSVFLPTLLHVYLFTGFFMLYGALKGKSRSGYLSIAVFIICPMLIIFIHPESLPLTEYASRAYQKFQLLNIETLKLLDDDFRLMFTDSYEAVKAFGGTPTALFENRTSAIFTSDTGVAIMRFIAFAYTYHYLNWFSKTSVIKWHEVSKLRLALIGVLWAAAVGLYLWDYSIGFNVLFLLSFLHVFLEFPLNHITFIGVWNEIFKGGGAPAPTAKARK
ncbi:MAG: hypothetical protein MUC87_14480 [Bacteroidia bacterium]|jgi:hypothetical protein|nr:hypothetical protein [Bacteroidia bacterium]